MSPNHFKHKQPRVIGIDIHPSCFAAAALTNAKPNKAQQLWIHKKVDMDNLKEWLQNNVTENDVMVLEAGCNSFEFVKTAEEMSLHAVVLDSTKVGQLSKAYCKNDSVDAVKLARIYLTGLPEEVWVPDAATRVRREIISEYDNATKDSTRCKNRIRSWLTEHHVKLPKGTTLTKPAGQQTVLKLYKWNDQQKAIVALLFDDLFHAVKKRKELTKLIVKEVMNNKDCIKLMQLCGIRALTAFHLYAQIGNVHRFCSAKKLAAYIGLVPTVKDSGSRTWSGGITKRGCRALKAKLTQAAHSVFKASDENGGKLKQWALALWMRKGSKNIAVTGIARKMVVSTWYCLKGFFTDLKEATKSMKTKADKLVQDLGKEAVLSLGYKKTKDFKEEFLQKLLTSS